jgi:hypothetical protein
MNNLPPRLAVRASVALGLSLAALSCSGNKSAAPVTTGSTPLPCDVNAIVVENCQSCHSSPPQNGAPMALVTVEDFQALTPADPDAPTIPAGAHVYQTAEQRIHDAQAMMPQKPNKPLDAADLATMDAWLNAGAPKTDGATCTSGDGDASVSVPDSGPPTISCTSNNATLSPASAWSMPASDDDDYVCYSVSLPVAAGTTNHVLGITPVVVNHNIVHHVLLFQADPSDTSITTTPQKCNPGGSLGWRIVYGWAPGGGPMETPPDVGFPYDATTKWVVQVHYNNIKGLAGQTDTSGFSFCSTDQPVKYDADVVAFGTMGFTIPPLATLDTTCTWTVPQAFAGVHAFAAFPHMHQLGTAIQTEQTPAGGGIIGMAENIPWNFNAQIWFPIQTTLNLGDVVTTRCAWNNTTSLPVSFGQNTEDEMCYSFTAYYPKVTGINWQWSLPAESSSCSNSAAGGLATPDAGWESDASFTSYGDGGTQ